MIEINEAPLTPAVKESIYKGSSKHAVAMSGLDPEIKSLSYLAMDGDQVAGALLMELFWSALHIKHLYVNSDFRGHSLGSKLLQKAIEVAKDHRCAFISVETLCPQMLNFYQKGGFILEFTRPGYERGASLFYLKFSV